MIYSYLEYLVPLPPYFESSIFVDCSACDVTSESWEDSGSFCDSTKQKVGCLVKFRPCLTFYELKELKKCLLKDIGNGMPSYEDKQLLKSCSIYKELFVKWAWILARLLFNPLDCRNTKVLKTKYFFPQFLFWFVFFYK